MRTRNLAELYDAPLMDWEAISQRLDAGFPQAPGSGGPDRHTSWLATINPDGTPHLTAVGALWVDGSWWFETGEGTRQARNIARDARCTTTVSLRGLGLIVNGTAARTVERTSV